MSSRPGFTCATTIPGWGVTRPTRPAWDLQAVTIGKLEPTVRVSNYIRPRGAQK